MASGKTHDAHGIIGAVLIGSVWAYLYSWASAIALSTGVLIGTLFLSPDLDMRHTRPSQRWGCLSILWLPYAVLFKHRGVSHHPIWGPISRLAYLTIILLPLWITVRGHLFPISLSTAGLVLLGIFIGNLIHLLGDI